MKTGKSVFSAFNLDVLFIVSFFIALLISLQIQADVEGLKSSGRKISFEIIVQKPGINSAGGGGIRLSLDGYGTFSPPGAPEIPGRIFNVAIPLSGKVSLKATVLERDDLGDIRLVRRRGSRLVKGENNTDLTETYLPDDPWEGKGLLPVVSAGKEQFMGRVRVLPVRVSPVGKEKSGYWIARRILIDITVDTEEKPFDSIESLKDPLSPAWSGIYNRVLVNPDNAAVFAGGIEGVKIREYSQAAERRIKISIPETGLYVLRADSIIAAVGGGPFSAGQFALKRYYYDELEPDMTRETDITFRIIKGEESAENYFEDDDLLVFHALGIRDDSQAGDIDAAFTDNHIVWLIEGEAGVMMSDGPGRVAAAGAGEACFTSEVKIREDTYYQKRIKSGTEDFYFVAQPELTEISVPFYCNSPCGTGNFKLTARIRGYATDGIKMLTFKVRNSSGTSEIGSRTLLDNIQITVEFDSNPASLLADGENQLVIESDKQYGCMLNDFSVEYPAAYIARDNILEFNTEGTGGTKSIAIQGFDSPKGYLLDITEESNPQFDTLQSGLFSGPDGSNKYTLSLELPADIKRRFIAFGEGAGRNIPNESVSLDSPSSLKGEHGPFHTLVISHRDFLPPQSTALSEYVTWRRGKGYRILTVDVQDVYDEFNGGLPSCAALKRFIKYGFNHWGIEFVMLVGDASEDHKGLYLGVPSETMGSPPDFVPAYTFSMRMDAVGYQDEVVGTDKYYSFVDDDFVLSSAGGNGNLLKVIDAVSGTESDIKMPSIAYPDVFVGRIPVGSDLEARGVFFKLRNYEESTIDNTWRRNIILFADDAWSGGASTYMYRASEEGFASSMENVADGIENRYPGGTNLGKLYLSKWTDGVQTGENPPANRSIATDSTRTYFTPYLIDRLNKGALFFAFQGHASRNNFTTEAGFSMFSQYRDVNDLTSNKNSILIGLGCHISDFTVIKELSQTGISGPGGDCISEQMILKVTSGSVAAYASGAFEDLDKNSKLCENMFDVIFSNPPSDTVPPLGNESYARWILGELVTAAEITHINTRTYGLEQINRYILFGDPMMNIDTGPPVMKLEVNCGNDWEEVTSDTINPANADSTWDIRFTANDMTALGGVELSIDGENWIDSLDVPLEDSSLTYARSYRVKLDDYNVSLDDKSLLFKVVSISGGEAGTREFYVGTVIRMFYQENGADVEILSGMEVPQDGDFKLEIDLPVSLDQTPLILLDDSELKGIAWERSQGDSTIWIGNFVGSFTGGAHIITAAYGEFSKDLLFTVGGNELAVETYNFPNPFSSGTNILFTLNFPADRGKIEIYNVSGILMRKFEISSGTLLGASAAVTNSVYWDGRDMARNRVANGTYIYILTINKSGKSVSRKGKIVKME